MDSFIQTCERVLERETFDEDGLAWFITYGEQVDVATRTGARPQRADDEMGEDGGDLYLPEVLNHPRFRKALRGYLVSSREQVLRFGFSVYWYLKPAGATRWWRDYLTGTTDEFSSLPLPFGTADLTRVRLTEVAYPGWSGLPARRLHAEWVDADDADGGSGGSSMYELGVYQDHHLTLIDTPPDLLKGLVAQLAPLATRLPVLAQTPVDENSVTVIPTTPFTDVLLKRRQLTETRGNHMHAEAVLSSPYAIFQASPMDLRGKEVEQASEQQQFNSTSPIDLLMQMAENQQSYTLQEAWAMIDHWQQRVATSRNQQTVSEQRRLAYGRSDLMENTKAVPGFMKLAALHKPEVINDFDLMEQRLRTEIAQVMGLPPAMFGLAQTGSTVALGQSESTSLTGQRVVTTDAERRLRTTVACERQFCEDMFQHTYRQVFGDLDQAELEAVADYLERKQQVMGQAKGARRELERLLAREDTPNAGSVAEARDKATRAAGSSDQRKQGRANLRRVRTLLDALRTGKRETTATLVFRAGASHDANTRLAGIVELFKVGLVASEVVEPYAQRALGPELVTRSSEEIAADNAPTGASSGAKKRPAAAEDSKGGRPTKRARADSD